MSDFVDWIILDIKNGQMTMDETGNVFNKRKQKLHLLGEVEENRVREAMGLPKKELRREQQEEE